MMMTYTVGVPLGDSLPLYLILFLLPHPLYLLLQELHLIRISFPYLISLPFLVLPSFLGPLPVDVEAVDVLSMLELIVKVKLAVVLFASGAVGEGEVFEACAVEEVLVVVT